MLHNVSVQNLEAEQEVLVNIADIANNLFAMESAVIRTEKAIARDGVEKAKQKLLYTQIFCQEAFEEIEKDAKETLTRICRRRYITHDAFCSS